LVLFVADPRASVTALPADGKRLICGRWAARQVQENLTQRRKGAKRKRQPRSGIPKYAAARRNAGI
jgi:hypothetical protein